MLYSLDLIFELSVSVSTKNEDPVVKSNKSVLGFSSTILANIIDCGDNCSQYVTKHKHRKPNPQRNNIYEICFRKI